MSDITTTTQDTYRNACITAYSFLASAMERAKENRGQTAAEYMGVLLLVAVIITAVVGSGVGSDLAGFLKDKVKAIADIK